MRSKRNVTTASGAANGTPRRLSTTNVVTPAIERLKQRAADVAGDGAAHLVEDAPHPGLVLGSLRVMTHSSQRRPPPTMKIERIRMFSAANSELTRLMPMSPSVPAAPPSFSGSLFACSCSLSVIW